MASYPSRSTVAEFYTKLLYIDNLESISTDRLPMWARRVVLAERQRRRKSGNRTPSKTERSNILTVGDVHSAHDILSVSSLLHLAEAKNLSSCHSGVAVDAIDFPNVSIDNDTADMIKATRRSLERQEGKYSLYSDGSFAYDCSINTCMGFAVAFERSDDQYQLGVLGTAEGSGNSGRAEVIGLLAAFLCCPRNQPATIHVDNKSVVNTFSEHLMDNLLLSNGDLWKLIRIAYAQQGQQINVKWVRGHSGIPGNMSADLWASMSHSAGLTPWRINQRWRPTS